MARPRLNGSAGSRVLLAGLLMALGSPRVVGAGQDAAPTPLVPAVAPMFAAVLSTAEADHGEQQESGTNPPKDKGSGDTLKFHRRSASLEYGRKFRLNVRAKIRGEVRASDAAITKDALNELDIPRHRFGFDGQVLDALRFKVDSEIESTNSAGMPTSPWRDVYVDVTQLEEVQFRYGQFKMPFSIDENTGSVEMDFAYRSTTATLLAPGRARGWMLHGDTLGHAFGYEYGVFKTDGTNALARTSLTRVNAGQTIAWRITSEPLRGLDSPLADVHIGYARTRGDLPEGLSGIKGRTILGADFYKPEFYVFGRRERRGVEFQWFVGPASVTMESIALTEERKGQSVDDTDLSPYQVKGWYVSGSYAFTGESKSRGLDKPRRPLFQGGIGALEAAIRVERISFGSVLTGGGSRSPRADVLPSNTDRILAFSGNWYPNRWIKVQMSSSRETFTDPTALATALRPTPSFWSHVLRVQFSI
jgi:phosphate-selective porin OprO and OprP